MRGVRGEALMHRRWRLDAELVYDNGVVAWSRWFRWRWQALVVEWWARNVSSWGGWTQVWEEDL